MNSTKMNITENGCNYQYSFSTMTGQFLNKVDILHGNMGEKIHLLKSPPRAPLGSGFFTDPPLENLQNFRKGGDL